MLTVKECKKCLEKDGKAYSDKEVEEIRQVLYKLAQIEYDEFKNKNHGKESNNLYKSINR